TLDDLFEAARAGTATGLVPESIARTQSWPNLVFVAVQDIAPSTVAVGWRTDGASLPVADFVELAKEVSLPALADKQTYARSTRLGDSPTCSVAPQRSFVSAF